MPDEDPVASVARLVHLLEVEPSGIDRYTGDSGQEEGRLFGGLVLGQAAIAAGRTAPDPTLHSLHAYFLRGGKPGTPIDYQVERVRDGRTFTSRRVLARQAGDAICDIMLSYVHLAMRIGSGVGLAEAHPLERCFRDVRAGLIHPPLDDVALDGAAKRALRELAGDAGD